MQLQILRWTTLLKCRFFDETLQIFAKYNDMKSLTETFKIKLSLLSIIFFFAFSIAGLSFRPFGAFV